MIEPRLDLILRLLGDHDDVIRVNRHAIADALLPRPIPRTADAILDEILAERDRILSRSRAAKENTTP